MAIKKINEELFIKIQGIFHSDGEDFIGLADEIAIPVIEENGSYLISKTSEDYISIQEYLANLKIDIPDQVKFVFIDLENNKIYENSSFSEEVEPAPDVLYIDKLTNLLYRFNGEQFISIAGSNTGDIKYSDITDAPTKLSQFENDENFLNEKKLSERLQLFYNKTETDEKFATKDFVNDQIKKIISLKGSLDSLDELDEIVNPKSGDVYYIRENGKYYVYIYNGWEDIGTSVDLSNYFTKEEIENKLSQLISDLNEQLKEFEGTFAKSDEVVKLSGGTMTGELHVVNPKTDSGAVNKKFMEDQIKLAIDNLKKIVNPTLVGPSVELEKNVFYATLGKYFSEKLIYDFSRGSITPAFGTSGFRSGDLQTIDSIDTTIAIVNGQLTITSKEVMKESEKDIVLNFNYYAGEQPINSVGEYYMEALPKGTISKTIKIKAFPAVFVDGKEASPYIFENKHCMEIHFDKEKDGEKQNVSIPSEFNIKGIKQYDPLQNKWDWIFGDQTESLTSFISELNRENYYLYKNNLPKMGERKVRFYYEEEEGEG